MDQKAYFEGIKQIFVDSQEFVDLIPEMMSLKVEDEKQGV